MEFMLESKSKNLSKGKAIYSNIVLFLGQEYMSNLTFHFFSLLSYFLFQISHNEYCFYNEKLYKINYSLVR